MSNDNTEHPPLTDLIGLAPDFTGGLSAEEYLRRQRCGECDEMLSALARVTAELEQMRGSRHEVFDASLVREGGLRKELAAARRDAEQARAELATAREERYFARVEVDELRRDIAGLTRWADGDEREDVPVDEIHDVLRKPRWYATPTAAPQADVPAVPGADEQTTSAVTLSAPCACGDCRLCIRDDCGCSCHDVTHAAPGGIAADETTTGGKP